LLFCLKPKTIYFLPSKHIENTPEIFDMDYKESILTHSNGDQIYSWSIWAKNTEPKRDIIFFHGNKGNMGSRLETYKMLCHELGFRVWTLDYRGYGKSSSFASQHHIEDDLVLFYQHLKTQLSVDELKNIPIYGRSLGGGVACLFCEIHNPKKLILEATFSSVVDVTQRKYPFLLGVKTLLKNQFISTDVTKNLKCPILISHSPSDQVIPYASGQKLFELTHGKPKEFFELKGEHSLGWKQSSKTYVPKLKKFLEIADS